MNSFIPGSRKMFLSSCSSLGGGIVSCCSENNIAMSENMIRANIRNMPNSIKGIPTSANTRQKPFMLAIRSRNSCPFVVRIINKGPWLVILYRSSIPYCFNISTVCQYMANISRIFQYDSIKVIIKFGSLNDMGLHILGFF